jgi:xanthine dehydrogenase iron-sulfur cluster and FAD-binding subunit A
LHLRHDPVDCHAAGARTAARHDNSASAAYALVATDLAAGQREPQPDDATIRDWLSGNVCRCTGYRQIYEAIQRAMLAESVEAAP